MFPARHCDQDALGTCTVNSAGVVLRATIAKKLGVSVETVPMPSRLFAYYNERLLEGTVRQDSGATIRDSMKALSKWGACNETEWPYEISQFRKRPTKALYADALVQARVTSYEAVSQTLPAMLAALNAGYPICIGFSVYESFESKEVARTGIVPLPARTERVLGGHAVYIFKADQSRQLFTCGNSWGDDWGQSGNFEIPFAYLLNANLAGDFWIIKTV